MERVWWGTVFPGVGQDKGEQGYSRSNWPVKSPFYNQRVGRGTVVFPGVAGWMQEVVGGIMYSIRWTVVWVVCIVMRKGAVCLRHDVPQPTCLMCCLCNCP